jgi:DNA polymerase
MHSVTLAAPTDFAGWRNAARALLSAEIAPERVDWSIAGERSLFDRNTQLPALDGAVHVSRRFLTLAETVSLHSDPDRFALLYRLLWRLQRSPALLKVAMDDDVARAHAMEKSVDRDIHKMHAFVRFRAVPGCEPKRYLAWFEPSHHIVEMAAPFFVRRFANVSWAILTPGRSAFWDMRSLQFGPGGKRCDVPAEDATEDLWRSYYASIFNPARLNVSTMKGHMPQRYWRNLPESSAIPHLIRHAQQRTLDMLQSAPTPVSKIKRTRRSLLSSAATGLGSTAVAQKDLEACRRCALWQNATQAVAGEGPQRAPIMLVGEQPGDQEDLSGKPFVGPAGQLLNRALAAAGLDRGALFITNAVKHFKFEPRGKRRIHKKPNELEIAACSQWLEHEIQTVRPQLIVALGATAARSLLGHPVTVDNVRGQIIRATDDESTPSVMVTVHPSSLLRLPDAAREEAYARFVEDLRALVPYSKHSSQ